MDEILNSLRSFLIKARVAGGLADPAAQKEIVLKALGDLEELEKKGYGAGCTSSMNVSPKSLSFVGHAFQEIVYVSNSGNNAFHFSVVDSPRGFFPQPSSADVSVGQTVAVGILRAAVPIPNNSPVSFRLRDNYMDEVPVQLEFDKQNAATHFGTFWQPAYFPGLATWKPHMALWTPQRRAILRWVSNRRRTFCVGRVEE